MHIGRIISWHHKLKMPLRQLVKVTEVFVFVSPFNSLIVHGSEVFTLDSCHHSLHLVSVFAFSHPVHWVSLVTGHSPSMQTPEPEQNTRLSLVSDSSFRALIGRCWRGLADRRGSHDAQSSVWKSGLFIAARTQLAAFCTPVTSHTRVNFHSRDEMWCQPLHFSNLFPLYLYEGHHWSTKGHRKLW